VPVRLLRGQGTGQEEILSSLGLSLFLFWRGGLFPLCLQQPCQSQLRSLHLRFEPRQVGLHLGAVSVTGSFQPSEPFAYVNYLLFQSVQPSSYCCAQLA
jgi:hypothetical protein